MVASNVGVVRAVLLLTAAAALGLTGCIPLPVVEGRPRFDRVVGPADSAAPCRVGVTSRREVLARLGRPSYACRFDPAVYAWHDYTTKRLWLQPYPFMHGWEPFPRDLRSHRLYVRFDAAGRVAAYRQTAEPDARLRYDESIDEFAAFVVGTAPPGWAPLPPDPSCPVCGRPFRFPTSGYCECCDLAFDPGPEKAARFEPPAMPATRPAPH